MSFAQRSSVISEKKLGCFHYIDVMMFCYRPRNQFMAYHRTGQFEDCNEHWKAFMQCINVKRLRQGGHEEDAKALEAKYEAEKPRPKSLIWEMRDVPPSHWPLDDERLQIWKEKALESDGYTVKRKLDSEI